MSRWLLACACPLSLSPSLSVTVSLFVFLSVPFSLMGLFCLCLFHWFPACLFLSLSVVLLAVSVHVCFFTASLLLSVVFPSCLLSSFHFICHYLYLIPSLLVFLSLLSPCLTLLLSNHPSFSVTPSHIHFCPFFVPLIVFFLSTLFYSSLPFCPFHSFHISISHTVTLLLSIVFFRPSLLPFLPPSLPPSCPYCPLISLLAVWPSTKLTANTQGTTAKTSQSSCQEAARRCHLRNTHVHTHRQTRACTHTNKKERQ